jgi:GNAT superfamily N-acetyltransferase
MQMLTMTHVRSEADAAEVRVLVAEFFDWMRGRYPEWDEGLDTYIRVQDIDGQMRELLTRFAPPAGECLLARVDGVAAGIVMTKPHSEGICEMNRMYVRAAARGHGVGRALVTEIMAAGRALGYKRMLLAAGPRHTEAVALYRSFGFLEDESLPDTGAGDVEVRMIRDL